MERVVVVAQKPVQEEGVFEFGVQSYCSLLSDYRTVTSICFLLSPCKPFK